MFLLCYRAFHPLSSFLLHFTGLVTTMPDHLSDCGRLHRFFGMNQYIFPADICFCNTTVGIKSILHRTFTVTAGHPIDLCKVCISVMGYVLILCLYFLHSIASGTTAAMLYALYCPPDSYKTYTIIIAIIIAFPISSHFLPVGFMMRCHKPERSRF